MLKSNNNTIITRNYHIFTTIVNAHINIYHRERKNDKEELFLQGLT